MRWLYNLASMATGLGITRNIVDCYAAIVSLYEEGDRIFLIGFMDDDMRTNLRKEATQLFSLRPAISPTPFSLSSPNRCAIG